MYKFVLYSVLITILSFVETFAQNESAKKPKFILTDIYVLAGELIQNSNGTSIGKYQEFLPNASILQRDFSDFSSGGSGTGRNSSPIFSVLAGFTNSNSQNKTLRFGASVFANRYVSTYISNYSHTPVDTLTSMQTGEKLYRSKFATQNYSASTQSVNLRFEAAYLYNFFPDDRISFYTGIGLGSNFSLNAHTDIYYSSEEFTRIERENGNATFGSDSWSWTDRPFRVNHNGNFGVNIYIPLGLDFQLTEKGAFHKTHLIYEFRPGFNGQFGGLGDHSGRQWEHKFGLKFALK